MAEKTVPELTGIAVDFTCNGRTTPETGRLLGAAAMIIETPRVEPLDSQVELRFRPRPASPLILARGFVSAQLSKRELRVHFTDLADAHRRHLLELLFPSGAERRTTRRISLVTQMRTIVGGQAMVGYTRDISVGGVFVETETPPERGTEVTLRFKLAPEAPILEVRATVVYSLEGEGMGLRFWDLPGEVHQALQEFIEQT